MYPIDMNILVCPVTEAMLSENKWIRMLPTMELAELARPSRNLEQPILTEHIKTIIYYY